MPSTIILCNELVERDDDVLILDTETTGRGQYAEIIEIAMKKILVTQHLIPIY